MKHLKLFENSTTLSSIEEDVKKYKVAKRKYEAIITEISPLSLYIYDVVLQKQKRDDDEYNSDELEIIGSNEYLYLYDLDFDSIHIYLEYRHEFKSGDYEYYSIDIPKSDYEKLSEQFKISQESDKYNL